MPPPANAADDTWLQGGAGRANSRDSGSGTKKNKAKSGSNMAAGALLICVPWVMFSGLVAVFTFFYHTQFFVVVFAVFGGFMVSVAMMLLDIQRKGGGSWYLFLGMLALLATLAGTICGMYTYHSFMFQYNSYEENRAYVNVLPSEPADAHTDAGKIIFSQDSRVDVSKSVGFHEGTFYCVAPIMDEDMDTRIEFWAAGVGCCSYRGDFSCDDAWDPKAKSGAVILQSEGSWIPTSRDYFVKAMHEAEVAYNLASADNPIFVQWVVDPQVIQDRYWQSAVAFLGFATCVYLVISIVLGAGLQVLNAKTK